MIRGTPFPAVSLEDQHGKVLAVQPGTRLVLFAADKAASDLATELLAAQPAGTLDRLQAVYLADISVPPALYGGPALQLAVGPIFAANDIVRIR